MCDLYLAYYERENYFVDEYGEIVYDLYRVITPGDLFLFKNIMDDYEQFPMVDHPEITVHIIHIPSEAICGRLDIPAVNIENLLDIQYDYDRLEEYERQRMANVAG